MTAQLKKGAKFPDHAFGDWITKASKREKDSKQAALASFKGMATFEDIKAMMDKESEEE